MDESVIWRYPWIEGPWSLFQARVAGGDLGGDRRIIVRSGPCDFY